MARWTSAGLILSWGSATALGPVCIVSVGALLVILVMSRNVEMFKVSSLAGGIEFRRLTQTVENQGAAIKTQSATIEGQRDTINKLVTYSLSEDVYNILWRLKNTEEWKYEDDEQQKRWCNTLLDHGYIQPKKPDYILRFGHSLRGKNLVDFAKPTPAGDFLIQLRGKAIFGETGS
jgi:hypothetical protein